LFGRDANVVIYLLGMAIARLPIDLLVCGSRKFSDYEHLCIYINKVQEKASIRKIISGGEKGADALAARYAQEKKIPLVEIRTDATKHGKNALFAHNNQMLDLCNKDNAGMVIAFWDSISPGTKSLLAEAEKRKIPCVIHRFGRGDPFAFSKGA